MSDVISLSAKREERESRGPHLTGEALCMNCKHAWAAVAPIGTTDLECPGCGTLRGVWKHPFGVDDAQERFVCTHCGADHFVVQRHRCLCVGCGATHYPWAGKA